MSEYVRFELDEGTGVGTIRLDRPKMNAINDEVVEGIRVAAREATFNDACRAVVVYGGDKIFAAGADIKQMSDRNPAEMMNRMGGLQAVFTMVEEIPKVTIAAICGFALGGGCELALACDWIIASDNAVFGQPEVNLGIPPGFGGTQRLPRRIGPARALELLTTARQVKADEASAIGLVNHVCPAAELKARGLEAARTIAAKGPAAVRLAKQAVLRGENLDLFAACGLETDLFAQAFLTQDRKEGMSAFLEKRPARFSGK